MSKIFLYVTTCIIFIIIIVAILITVINYIFNLTRRS